MTPTWLILRLAGLASVVILVWRIHTHFLAVEVWRKQFRRAVLEILASGESEGRLMRLYLSARGMRVERVRFYHELAMMMGDDLIDMDHVEVLQDIEVDGVVVDQARVQGFIYRRKI